MRSVSTTDGEADVRVLGSQSGLSPHSPEGQEDPGQDAGVPRHQTVTVQRHGVIRRDALPPLAPAPLLTGRREKEERRKNGTKSPIRGWMTDNSRMEGGGQEMRAEDLSHQWRSGLLRKEGSSARVVLSVKAKQLAGPERQVSRCRGTLGGGPAGTVRKAIQQNSVCRLLYCHSCRFFHP